MGRTLCQMGRLAALSGFALAAVTVSMGCGERALRPGTPEKEPVRLRLAYGKKIHYAPQIVALKRGYFDDEGLRVDAKAVQAGIQAAEALTSGSADAAVMGDAPGIIAAASGMPVRLVCSYGGGERMHRLVAAPDSGIRHPADLRGTRVGLQKGSSTHGAFLLFLEKHGLSADDLRLVPLDPSVMPDAVLTDQIDAAVGSEPWPSNIEERVAGSYEVATLSGLGNTFPLVMLVTESYAAERPDAVLGALRATQMAVDYMQQNPEAAAGLISEATGVPAERERKVMETLEWAVVLDDATVESLVQTARFLRSQDKISGLPEWDQVIDRSFIRRMRAGG